MNMLKKLEILWNEQKVLCIIAAISLFILLSYVITNDYEEIIKGIDKWYKLLSELSMGIIVNFLFYFYQVFLPKLDEQERAYAYIKKDAQKLYFILSDIVLIVDNFIKISDNKFTNICYGRKYFIRYNDEHDTGGWLTCFELSGNGIRRYNKLLNKTIKKIKDSVLFLDNNINFINCIAELENNKYIEYLIDHIENGENNIQYGNLRVEYDELRNIMVNLGRIVNKNYQKMIMYNVQDVLEFEKLYDKQIENRKWKIVRIWKCF